MRAILLSVLSLIVACGGGGVKGECSNRDGFLVANFKSGGKVEMTAGSQHQEVNYGVVDGKLAIGDPADPKDRKDDHALILDGKGCFNLAGLIGEVCAKGHSWS